MSNMGRPTKYEPRFDEMLIEHMSKGLSFESFAGKIGVATSTIKLWAKNQPNFSAAREIGRAAGLLKDEEIGNKFIEGKQRGHAGVWQFKMKNCHKWTDRTDVTSNGGSIDELIAGAKKADEQDNEDN